MPSDDLDVDVNMSAGTMASSQMYNKDDVDMDLALGSSMELENENDDFPSTSSNSSSSSDEYDEELDDEDMTSLSGLTDQSEPNSATVIVFDWDDTLLASSFLSERGHRLDNNLPFSSELKKQLEQLEDSIISVLEVAMKYGQVHIVTNAETGWVQLSAQKFVPRVVPYLHRVSVLSARSTYEDAFPASPLKWKFHAFQERLAPYFARPVEVSKNIISFGDSHVEREAVRAVTRGLPNTRTKSVKFAERPSIEQLRRQIELVTNCFQYIFSHDGDLDLMLTISLMSS